MGRNVQLELCIDELIVGWPDPPLKKKMFGGAGYLFNGNLAFGTHKNGLLFRVAEDAAADFLARPGYTRMKMGMRTAPKNWLVATPEATAADSDLLALLQAGRDYALSLPPKYA